MSHLDDLVKAAVHIFSVAAHQAAVKYGGKSTNGDHQREDQTNLVGIK